MIASVEAVSAKHARQRPQQAVAAHRRDGLVALDRAAGLLGGMLDVARPDRAVISAEPRELGLGGGQALERPATARGRVHQQQEAAAQPVMRPRLAARSDGEGAALGSA